MLKIYVRFSIQVFDKILVPCIKHSLKYLTQHTVAYDSLCQLYQIWATSVGFPCESVRYEE